MDLVLCILESDQIPSDQIPEDMPSIDSVGTNSHNITVYTELEPESSY